MYNRSGQRIIKRYNNYPATETRSLEILFVVVPSFPRVFLVIGGST